MSVRVELTPTTVDMLNELAGGRNKKSAYLERMIPILYRANQEVEKIRKAAEAEAIAQALVEDSQTE